MLNVVLGDAENSIYNTSVYFKNTYEPEWFSEDQTKQMILDIDKSEVLGDGAIKSPVLGVIPPTGLSGGVKTLILIDHDSSKIFNASNCGDNCALWLLRLGKEKDITVNLRHVMNFGEGDFEIKILNDGSIVHNMADFVSVAGDYL